MLYYLSVLKNLKGLKIGKFGSTLAFEVSMYLRNAFIGQYPLSFFFIKT